MTSSRRGEPTRGGSLLLRRRRGRAAVAAAVAAAVLLACCAAGLARVYVVPPTSAPPQRTDVVVVLGGLAFGHRLERGVRVVEHSPHAVLLVSVSRQERCPTWVAARVAQHACFVASPATTQGEARAAAAYARRHRLRSMTVVTTADQLLRARLRFSRCWPGPLSMVEAPTSRWRVVAQVPHQVGATVKALVWSRDC